MPDTDLTSCDPTAPGLPALSFSLLSFGLLLTEGIWGARAVRGGPQTAQGREVRWFRADELLALQDVS